MQNNNNDNNKKLIIAGVVVAVLFVGLIILFYDGMTSNRANKDEITPTAAYTDPTPYEVIIPSSTPTQLQKIITSKEGCGIDGEPIINVSQKVINDHDYGNDGYEWGIDTYVQNIKVWEKPAVVNTYCAEETLKGNFDALAGKLSPGDKYTTLKGNEDGTLNGKSRVTIVGSLRSNPSWPTTGTIPTLDLQCVFEENCPETGNNYWDVIYFENVAAGYPVTDWYIWFLQNGNNIWVDSSDGTSGDIL